MREHTSKARVFNIFRFPVLFLTFGSTAVPAVASVVVTVVVLPHVSADVTVVVTVLIER